MEAIYKLNDTLRYSTQVNNKNVIAAICAQELEQILKYTTTYSDQKLVEELIKYCFDEALANYGGYACRGTKMAIVAEDNNNNNGNNGGSGNIPGGGNSSVDLTNYYTKREIDRLLLRKQNELTAGENVEIEDDVISVDLSGIETDGSVLVFNDYGSNTSGAISQKFFTQEVQSNTENIQTNAEEIKAISEGMQTVTEEVKSNDDDIAALMAAVFPFKINYFRGGGTYEKGSSQSITLTWEYDREIDSQKINGVELAKSLRNKTYSNVNKDTSYTLNATSGNLTVNSTVSVKFSLKKYWGVSANDSLTNSEILTLDSGWASRAMSSTTFDCTGGKYVYYVLPSSMISGIEFWINGLQNTDWNTEEIRLTNASGYSENYTIFRINTIQTGVLKIEVK